MDCCNRNQRAFCKYKSQNFVSFRFSCITIKEEIANVFYQKTEIADSFDKYRLISFNGVEINVEEILDLDALPYTNHSLILKEKFSGLLQYNSKKLFLNNISNDEVINIELFNIAGKKIFSGKRVAEIPRLNNGNFIYRITLKNGVVLQSKLSVLK